jgi:hypothetical protein
MRIVLVPGLSLRHFRFVDDIGHGLGGPVLWSISLPPHTKPHRECHRPRQSRGPREYPDRQSVTRSADGLRSPTKVAVSISIIAYNPSSTSQQGG